MISERKKGYIVRSRSTAGPRIGSSRAPASVRRLASSFGTLEIVKAASSASSSSIALVSRHGRIDFVHVTRREISVQHQLRDDRGAAAVRADAHAAAPQFVHRANWRAGTDEQMHR